MYKSTSNFTNYMGRKASKSLRPTKTGDNADLAQEAWTTDTEYKLEAIVAQKEERARLDLQISIVAAEHREMQEYLTATNPRKLTGEKLNRIKLDKIVCKRGEAAKRYAELAVQLQLLKRKRSDSGLIRTDSFESAFVDAAQLALPKEIFCKIKETARNLITNNNGE